MLLVGTPSLMELPAPRVFSFFQNKPEKTAFPAAATPLGTGRNNADGEGKLHLSGEGSLGALPGWKRHIWRGILHEF